MTFYRHFRADIFKLSTECILASRNHQFHFIIMHILLEASVSIGLSISHILSPSDASIEFLYSFSFISHPLRHSVELTLMSGFLFKFEQQQNNAQARQR